MAAGGNGESMTAWRNRGDRAMQPGITPETLELERFLPYRLAVLSDTISRTLARVYADRFQLSVAEWRVMALLGRFPGLSAAEVAARGAMDKVMVSRAVARLLGLGRIQRQRQARDRRCSSLRLSASGRTIYREIVPLAKSYELALLAAVPPSELAAFDRAFERLLSSAREIGMTDHQTS